MGIKVIGVLFLVSILACSNTDASSARRSPVAPPPLEVEIPKNLIIPVDIDGVRVEPISYEKLKEINPHYQDSDRSAWRLTEVLGEAFQRRGGVVEAMGLSGVGIRMRTQTSDKSAQPVLFLTRRGDIIATSIDPADPFPQFHGRGGRLRRPGDPHPRISPVTRLRVTLGETKNNRKREQSHSFFALLGMEVRIDEKRSRVNKKVLLSLPALSIQGDAGDKRTAWSVRDLTTTMAGGAGRVVAIIGRNGKRVKVLKSVWEDKSQTPVLRVNQRGLIKFHWIGKNGEPIEEGQVRGVVAVEMKTD